MRVFVEDSFDSAHWLPNVPVEHKCHSMHGHTYRIRLEIGGETGLHTGWIIDYADIMKVWAPLKKTLDHKILNEIDGLQNSTCELLVEWIWNRLSYAGLNVERLEIRETDTTGIVKERG